MSNATGPYLAGKGTAYAETVLIAGQQDLDALARNRARKLRAHIGPDDSVLEIGVGVCSNLAGITAASKVGQDIGDFAQESCARLGIPFVTELSELEGRTFSIILMHHVLEHVPDPLDLLREAQRFLARDGKLLIYVPDDKPRRERRYVEDEPNHHLYSWSPLTLGNLIKASGMQLEDINTGPFGYERRLAPLARFGDPIYRAALAALRFLRPVREIRAVARLNNSGAHETA